MSQDQLEQVYDMLFGASFEQWYQDDFEAHVCGDEDCKTKEEILEDLKHLLR